MAKLQKPQRVLFATLGSLGDLHPCLALATELKHRGHAVTIATTEFYRKKIERLGLAFHALRPHWDPTDPALIGQCANLKKGPEILFRKLILPHLRDTYHDLLAAARACDLMLAGELVYAAPLVAEKLDLPWVSLILSPCSFLSAHDPSVLVNVPSLIHVRALGVRPYRMAFNLGKWATRHWWTPVRELRREEGLRAACDPLMRDKFSRQLVLALFSSWLAKPQPDWPANTVQPGFVFFDEPSIDTGVGTAIKTFLDEGDPPVLFTLGSTAAHCPGDFYKTSLDAVQRLGVRAIFIGASPELQRMNPDVLSVPYAPYGDLFPRAAVIVHQGGSGTTAQALRAGRPMLVVPFGWDQPDNGARVQHRGAGLCLSRKEYAGIRPVKALEQLLSNSSFTIHAKNAAEEMRQENALERALRSIERILIRG